MLAQTPAPPKGPTGGPVANPRSGTRDDPIARAIADWPAHRPLAIVTAGRLPADAGRPAGDGPADLPVSAAPRWTILASPESADPIADPADLDRVLAPRSDRQPEDRAETTVGDAPPFRSGRLVMLTYELGHALEPAAGPIAGPGAKRAHTPAGDPPPLGFVADCRETFTYDHATGRWSSPPPTDTDSVDRRTNGPTAEAPTYRLGPLESEVGSAAYRAAVRTALNYIRAGDVYQVNLAHRLAASFEGSPRALAADLFARATPAHGFYAELSLPTDRPTASSAERSAAILSMSPELFVSFDPATRVVRASPMKGTRPITGDPAELRAAAKDRAELDMITDLMRNDLGRVCAFGSMRVESARTIEAHGSSVWQATSTVSGTLRDGLTPADLVRAAFPPGSVTGAPKVRAMQIIRELEPVARGFYCGSLGWLDDGGGLSLNVAIRTATIGAERERGPGRLTYHAGAGIVADSDPDAEWAETQAKAAILRGVAGSPGASRG